MSVVVIGWVEVMAATTAPVVGAIALGGRKGGVRGGATLDSMTNHPGRRRFSV
jgi:hypothetical protein